MPISGGKRSLNLMLEMNGRQQAYGFQFIYLWIIYQLNHGLFFTGINQESIETPEASEVTYWKALHS